MARRALREAARAAGGQPHETVHGIQLVQTGAQDTWLWSRAELAVQTLFGKDFSMASRAARDGSQLALACDLFASADFETSDRTRFLALVTAVEALAVGRYRIADELQGVVDGWLASLTAPPNGIEQEDLLRFRSRVSQLKQESITNSVRQLVNDHMPSTEGVQRTATSWPSATAPTASSCMVQLICPISRPFGTAYASPSAT